jgi:8-oxo-dGTP diphosphatase
VRYPRILRVADLIRTSTEDAERAAGRLPRSVTLSVAELPAGLLVTLELRRPWWDRRPRNRALRGLQQAMDRIRSTQRQLVVAAAIIANHRVLVAQRGHPPELAGRWEFPGGKVEPGESVERALVRECLEELGVDTIVLGEIARRRIDGADLILLQTKLIDPAAQPVAVEHISLRWVSAAELDGLDWLSTNTAFSPDVARRL